MQATASAFGGTTRSARVALQCNNQPMEPVSLRIALEDTSRGYEVSPERVPLSLLAEFAGDVEDFVRGAAKEVDAPAIEVSVVKGSLAFVMTPLVAPVLLQDLRALLRSSDMTLIDPKRRAVVTKWQTLARGRFSRSIKIDAGPTVGAFSIDSTSDFKTLDADEWVAVERYIKGEIMDLGGVKSSNAHIKLPDGSRLMVQTDKRLIKAEKTNLVYQEVHLRVRAELNIRTKQLREVSLIEFVKYEPRFDEVQFNKAVERGGKSWSDVEDPAQWVKDLRGG